MAITRRKRPMASASSAAERPGVVQSRVDAGESTSPSSPPSTRLDFLRSKIATMSRDLASIRHLASEAIRYERDGDLVKVVALLSKIEEISKP